MKNERLKLLLECNLIFTCTLIPWTDFWGLSKTLYISGQHVQHLFFPLFIIQAPTSIYCFIFIHRKSNMLRSAAKTCIQLPTGSGSWNETRLLTSIFSKNISSKILVLLIWSPDLVFFITSDFVWMLFKSKQLQSLINVS